MKFCAGGDLVIQVDLPAEHAGADKISRFIQEADARIVNLEVPVVDEPCYCSTFSGDPPLSVKPFVIDVMRRYGFQACGCANNHTLDYGPQGLQQTMGHLHDAGFLFAGIGNSLDEATAPATIPTGKGNVAYIAQSAVYFGNDTSRAGNGHENIPPRPGMNGLRHIDESIVTSEEMAYIKDLAHRTMVNAEDELEDAFGYAHPDDGTFSYGQAKFRVGEKTGKFSRCHPADMERTERAVRNAKRTHSYCVVSLHSHQFRGRLEYETDYYVEEFAHRCIDAGADAFVGTGTHMPKAVEVYKGKPIFYCTGNFIFQGHYISRMSADFIEGLGYPLDMKAPEVRERQHAGATHSMEDIPIYFQGIVPRWEMENGVVTKIELLPVEMGMQEPLGLSGFPTPMDPALLMEHMETVCKPYGTKLAVKGDVIEVLL